MRGTDIKTRDRAATITKMVLEGKRTSEIGKVLGISGARVRRIADLFKIPLPGAKNVRLAFYTRRKRGDVVMALAKESGQSPSAIIDHIVGTVVDDGIERARHRLGKTVVPAKVRQ